MRGFVRLVLLAQTLYGDMDTYREISENVVYIMLYEEYYTCIRLVCHTSNVTSVPFHIETVSSFRVYLLL